MSTNLMRFVDFWFGVPFCFLLKVFESIEKIAPLRRKAKTSANILYIKLSEMGGIVLSYSLMRKVQREFPASIPYFLTLRKNKPLVEVLQIVPSENIFTIRDDSLAVFIYDSFRILLLMSWKRMDLTFDLELFSRFSAILTYLSGAPTRVGYYRYYFEGLYRGNLLTHNFQYNPLLHISESFLSLAQGVKENRKISPELKSSIDKEEIEVPSFIAKPQDIEEVRHKLSVQGVQPKGRIFLVNPGDGVIPLREWPLDNFSALVNMLIKDTDNYVIIVGTEGVSKKAREMLSALDSRRCLDFTDKTTIVQLLCLFSIADGLIVNDCGLAHIASLTSIKKFVIFGPESPQIYSPMGCKTFVFYSRFPCSPCLSSFNHRKSACRDNRCLKLIQPQEVFKTIQECI